MSASGGRGGHCPDFCTDFCVEPEARDVRQLNGDADAHALMQIAIDAAVERARVFRALVLGCKGYLREAEIRRAARPESPTRQPAAREA